MQTITIPATDIRPNDVLCGDDGKPFARVTRRIGRRHVQCLTESLDANPEPFFSVCFPAGTTAAVQR